MKALLIDSGDAGSVGVVFPLSQIRVTIRRHDDRLILESGSTSLTVHDLVARLDSGPGLMEQLGFRVFSMSLNWSLGGLGWPSVDAERGVSVVTGGLFGASTDIPTLNCVIAHRIGRTSMSVDGHEVLRLSPGLKILDLGNVSPPGALLASALCLYNSFERSAGFLALAWSQVSPAVSTEKQILLSPALNELFTLQMRLQRKSQRFSQIPPRGSA